MLSECLVNVSVSFIINPLMRLQQAHFDILTLASDALNTYLGTMSLTHDRLNTCLRITTALRVVFQVIRVKNTKYDIYWFKHSISPLKGVKSIIKRTGLDFYEVMHYISALFHETDVA